LALRRFLFLTFVLLVEGLILGVSFNSTLAQRLPPGWWQGLFQSTHVRMPLAAVIAAGVFVVAGNRIRQIVLAHPAVPGDKLNVVFTVQLCAFALFYQMTSAMFRPVESATEHPAVWIITWFAFGVITLLLWLRAVIPLRTIAAIIIQAWIPLSIGVVFGAAAWAAGYATQLRWWQMQLWTLNGAAAILRLVDPTAFTYPPAFRIGDGSFVAAVSPECSGYEGIGMIWAFLAAYFWMFRKRLRLFGALVLVPAATLCVWLANMVRIAVLVLIGAHFSPAIAVGGFHSYAGTILFAGISIATVVIAEHSPFFSRRDNTDDAPRRNPAAPLLIPFLAATAAKLITGAFSSEHFDPLYPLAVAAAVAALLWYRRDYLNLDRRVSLPAPAVGIIVAIACVLLPAPESSMQPSAGWLIVRCVGFIAVAPIIEELAFRSYLARRLTAADFEAVSMRDISLVAIIGSTILFAAAHGAHWRGAAVAGVAYVWIARRTGRLSDAICAHAVTNAVLAIMAIATGHWWLIA